VLVSCYADRPVLFALPDGSASQGQPSGGQAGAGSGAAGVTGTAGAYGAAGGNGSAGTGAIGYPSCDVQPVIQKYQCTLMGACHDSNGSAAGLDLATAGWEQRLLGNGPGSFGPGVVPSKCGDEGRIYLIPGSQPAKGLFLDKLMDDPPPCGFRMPFGFPAMTATDLQCIQAWANALTAP
jgi:hypothetical protein